MQADDADRMTADKWAASAMMKSHKSKQEQFSYDYRQQYEAISQFILDIFDIAAQLRA